MYKGYDDARVMLSINAIRCAVENDEMSDPLQLRRQRPLGKL